MFQKALPLCLISLLLITGCATQAPAPRPNSNLTQGNVQMNLQVGQTRKDQVLSVFGAPNITTRDGAGREVWTYQRAAQVTQSGQNSQSFWLLLFGQNSQNSYNHNNSRMTTLIIKFNPQDIVEDFRSQTSDF